MPAAKFTSFIALSSAVGRLPCRAQAISWDSCAAASLCLWYPPGKIDSEASLLRHSLTSASRTCKHAIKSCSRSLNVTNSRWDRYLAESFQPTSCCIRSLVLASTYGEKNFLSSGHVPTQLARASTCGGTLPEAGPLSSASRARRSSCETQFISTDSIDTRRDRTYLPRK